MLSGEYYILFYFYVYTSEITASGEGERVRQNDPEIVCFQILQKASFSLGVALLYFHILEGVILVA